MRLKIPAKIRVDVDLPVNVEPADPEALGRFLRRSKLAILAGGAAAGFAIKAWLDRAVPDEAPGEDDPRELGEGGANE